MGVKRLKAIQRRWRAGGIVFCLLVALAAAIVVMSIVVVIIGKLVLVAPWWWSSVLVFAGCFGGVLLLVPVWRISLADVASYLDRRLPELEDSCGLLLPPEEELRVLERLQAARVEERLLSVKVPNPMTRRLLRGLGIVGIALVVSFGILYVCMFIKTRTIHEPPVPDFVDPVVQRVQVRIEPPAYTGRGARGQDNLSVEAEEGALVRWEVVTNVAVDAVAFIFNDTAVKLLRRERADRWTFSTKAVHGGYYQVKVGWKLSTGLYKFGVIKDEAPKVKILRPKGYTVIDYGQPTKVPLQVELSDDYGITGSSIIATVSSGRGEAVTFRKQELYWDRGFSGERNDAVSRVLDLPALGLKPGDELYFYCRVRDNHGQEGQSDMYILSLIDTAQLMSLEGMTLPTDVKPEFFRSERQIIIETGQLLRAKDTIPVQAFKDRSNGLGIDQKLLRLRYGKFLGEEAEEGERGGSDTTSFGEFGNAARILDVYSDKHDNAEDATFLEPAVKAQLRATLSEMWKAELQFRVYKPHDALPYCYKALRLLKDLQQQSRSYVAKTGVKLTPLNPDKRLTGELGAIAAPVQRLVQEGGLSEEEVLRMGLAVLEGIRAELTPGNGDMELLRRVEGKLGGAAAAKPGEFLAGYEGMKKLMAMDLTESVLSANKEDILAAETAIVKLLPGAEERPGASKAAADGGLGRLYFGFLK